jgi:hypothetical protein
MCRGRGIIVPDPVAFCGRRQFSVGDIHGYVLALTEPV